MPQHNQRKLRYQSTVDFSRQQPELDIVYFVIFEAEAEQAWQQALAEV